MDPIANLATALVKAQASAQAVEKGSYNAFSRYKYASAEALIAEGREALSGAGLALMTLRWEVLPPNAAVKEGATQPPSARVKVYYLLVHTSGESIHIDAETSVIPEKGRPQDKAEATALTYNLGYLIRGLLLLPREEEGSSVDERDDRGHREPAREQRREEPKREPAKTQAPPPSSPAFDASRLTTEEEIAIAIDEAASIDVLKVIAVRIPKVDPALSVKAIDRLKSKWGARRDSLSQSRAA